MSKCNITLTIHIKWWVKYYLFTVELFCDTFNCEPDYDKVSRFITNHGVKIN